MNQSERRLYLIQELLKENSLNIDIPTDSLSQKELLRGLMNIRKPKKVDLNVLKIQDEYLQEELKKRGVVHIDAPGISLWQGDITRLDCDAIVNAANSQMLGCFYPNHTCIDNCIHTYAGMQLRLECADLMSLQDSLEPTGSAKITKAYNLPCKYIIHTVGPIIYGKVTKKDCDLLKSCYESCLKVASENQLESIAFCCISTGEFHFPNELAAKIAIDTVKEFMKKDTSVKKVILNVFKDVDKEIYQRYLG